MTQFQNAESGSGLPILSFAVSIAIMTWHPCSMQNRSCCTQSEERGKQVSCIRGNKFLIPPACMQDELTLQIHEDQLQSSGCMHIFHLTFGT